MAEKDVLGRAGEDRAVRHIAALGWGVLARNWRCPLGEIDVIALDGDDIVSVEVKTRRSLGFGHPFEAITGDKMSRLRRLAVSWAAEHPELARGRRLRIDAIAITGADPETAPLEHLRDLR